MAPEEGGAEVDGDGGEPDHEEAECDALGVVPHHLQGVQVAILDIGGQHRAGVQHGGQEVHLGGGGVIILKQGSGKLGADWLWMANFATSGLLSKFWIDNNMECVAPEKIGEN